MLFRKITCLCFVLIIVACPVYAEENTANGGTITGIIHDSDLNPIEGVDVKIIGADGIVFTTKTDADGKYKHSNIPAGYYRVNFYKEGYGTRTKNPVVVVNGGNHVVKPKMMNTKDIHKRKIEPLLHQVTDNIGSLFELDDSVVDALHLSISNAINAALKLDQSMISIVIDSRYKTSSEILETLLSHTETKNALTKHLNAQQIKDYINFTKARQKNAQQACIHFIAALLEQSLSLTVDQRNRIIQILIENADKELTLENIINEPFQRTVYLINNNLKLKTFFKHILNQTQRETWQVMQNIYAEDRNESKDIVGVEVLEAPPDEANEKNKAVEKPENQKKEPQTKSKEEIRETLLRQLAKTVLTAHTEQLGIRDEQALKRLDLAATGVAHQFTENQIEFLNTRLTFVEALTNLMRAVSISSITREEANKKLNTIWQDFQEKKNDIQGVVEREDKTNQPHYQHTIKNMYFDQISYILNHPLYQHTVKDVLSEDAYTQYIEKQTEREEFCQQAARDLVVANLDMFLLLNRTQRKQLEIAAEQVTLPIISSGGLAFISLKLFLSRPTEIWSPWQLQMASGG